MIEYPEREGLFSNNSQINVLARKTITIRLLAFMQNERKPFFDGVSHTAQEMLKLVG